MFPEYGEKLKTEGEPEGIHRVIYEGGIYGGAGKGEGKM
jgi:hypothetical protein